MAKHKKYHEGKRMMKHGSHSEDHMITNSEHEIANMPQHIVMKPYPYPSMMDENYNDGISGIDHQMSQDHGMLRKQYKPHKF